MNPAPSPGEAANAELWPGFLVDGYVIERKLGAGGMGMVYGAQHQQHGRRAAIKVLGQQFCKDPHVVQRFEQEARLVNEIHHPNIVDIFHFGELPDGRKFLAMEWLVGESLSDRIDRGPVHPAEAIEILDGIADALEAVHARAIVHRDLKSDNVYLTSVEGQQRIKLLDFGLAKLSANDPRAITKTKTGIIVGTPHYMAPEQARGRPVDHRTDVYALGVLSYKVLTGRLPFSGQPIDLLVHHLKTPPPSPSAAIPTIPEGLSAMVVRMMAKNPDERPSLADLRRGFAALRRGEAPPAMSVAGAPAVAAAATVPAPQVRSLRAIHVLLIAIGVLAAATIAFVLVRSATG